MAARCKALRVARSLTYAYQLSARQDDRSFNKGFYDDPNVGVPDALKGAVSVTRTMTREEVNASMEQMRREFKGGLGRRG